MAQNNPKEKFVSQDITPLEGHEFHLYVVEIVGFGVKVGISIKPAKRINNHRRDAEKFDMKLGRTWVSAPHVEARSNERRLVELSGGSREYLRVDFDETVSIAESLPKTRVSESDRTQIEADRGSHVSMFWPIGTTKEDVRRYAQNVGLV
ncbi:hypothetical protein A9310_04080 [Gordonia sp. UCD-TK1]|nr:hypothetical protein A9310_04080 [Gordonia sp. UCD-TK1]